MARVPLRDPTDLPPGRRALLESLVRDVRTDDDPDGEALDLYRAMAHDPELLDAFRSFATALRCEGALSAVERELIVLETARAAGSRYQWHQHVPVGVEEGLLPAQIRAVATRDLDGLTPAHAALVGYVERFVAGDVDDVAHERLTDHYDELAAPTVGLLAGLALVVARLIDAIDVEVAGEFVGWELENL